MKQSFYVVMRAGKILYMDDDRLLGPTENNLPGTLFDDYGPARNAVKRTLNAWKKVPQQRALNIPFEIKRLEF